MWGCALWGSEDFVSCEGVGLAQSYGSCLGSCFVHDYALIAGYERRVGLIPICEHSS